MCREYTTVTTSLRDYNPLAIKGQEMSDKQFIEDWNNFQTRKGRIDPSLANTKELPIKILELEEKDDIRIYMDRGMNELEAKAKARNNMRVYAKNMGL